MRDIVIFLIIFGTIPFVLKRPAVGVLVFAWISIMNPHRLTYGMARDFPFAAVIAVLTIVSLLFTKEKRKYVWTPASILLLALALWMTFTTVLALLPVRAWDEWSRVFKTLLMVALTIVAINEKKDLQTLVWVLGLSLGFYGLKGGLFSLATGGSYRVWGPDSSYIGENNALAVALVMTVPILWYLRNQTPHKMWRRALTFITLMSIVSAAGSYSRGALLAAAAMLSMLWLKSTSKLATGFGLLLVVPIVYLGMPDQWRTRMSSISDYQSDGSSLGRINAWHFAVEVANRFFTGGGFNVFDPTMFLLYAPNPTDFHVSHSIYFQVLGEHGYVGLILYLCFIAATWHTARSIMRACKQRPDLAWAKDLARACQVSMVGFLVGGAFLSLAYYDYFYYLMAVLMIMKKLVAQEVKVVPAMAMNMEPLGSRQAVKYRLRSRKTLS